MLLPFSNDTWAGIIKDKISVANATLDYRNLAAPLAKVAALLENYYIGVDTYQMLVIHWGVGVPNETADEKLKTAALDAMQRAMLNFALADSLIYLIAHVSNDGVTVKKNEDETTIFKYQQDELKEQLLTDAHFWLSRLLELLASNTTLFASYANETNLTENFHKPELEWIRVAFRRYMQIDDDSFFRFFMGLISDNVATLYARLTGDEYGKIPDVPTEAKKAFVYSTTADILESAPFANLPTVLRRELQSEQIKNKDLSDQEVRMKKADFWRKRASVLWTVVEQTQKGNKVHSLYNSPSKRGGKYAATI